MAIFEPPDLLPDLLAVLRPSEIEPPRLSPPSIGWDNNSLALIDTPKDSIAPPPSASLTQAPNNA
ncbi:hypothetical protein Bca4012_009271 [Brassica carinata]|uniref:Uncharacterized protein n=1 Tax=Brassica carinata TaxID=52824 RepID=A0A8X7S1Q5_BRACI|nr:hypothetical protein Bca52824_034534 [Brassica carinata]